MDKCECGYEYQLHHYDRKKYCIYCLTPLIVSDVTIKRFGRDYIQKYEREFFADFLPAYLDLTGREKIRYVKLGFEGLSAREQEDSIRDFIGTDRQCFAEYIADAV